MIQGHINENIALILKIKMYIFVVYQLMVYSRFVYGFFDLNIKVIQKFWN